MADRGLNQSFHNAELNYTNLLDLDELQAAEAANQFIQMCTLFSLAVLGYIGNFMIIAVLYRKFHLKRHFSNIDYLILQLSVSDVLVACFCVLADAIWKLTFWWLAGDFMCKCVKYMQMFSLYASTFIMVSISFDRCMAIVNPIPRFDRRKVVRIMVIISWILAGVFSFPQVLVFRTRQPPQEVYVSDVDVYQCVTYGAYTEDWHQTAYVMFTFCIMFAIPLLLIVVSYLAIFVQLHRQADPTRAFANHESIRGQRMKKAKLKSLWISLAVIITFVICWCPYYISMLYYLIVKDDDNAKQNMSQVIFFFGMSNSVLNPLIYGAFHMARKSQVAWRKRGHPGSNISRLPDDPVIKERTTPVRLGKPRIIAAISLLNT